MISTKLTALPAKVGTERELASTGSTGDLLLVFNGNLKAYPSRDSHSKWDPLEESAGALLSTRPSPGWWRGHPHTFLSEGDYQVWLLGEIFGGRPGSDPTTILRRAIRTGAFGQTLNGHFLLLARNIRERHWHVWTNRLATLHAYYAYDGNRAAVGTFAPSVIAAASARCLDWPAITGFFSFGFFPQDRTHFEDVRILRPASHYVFDEDGVLVKNERYWEWWHKPDHKRSYETTVVEFGATLGNVIADQTYGKRIAVPISGGLDSRTAASFFSPPAERSLDDSRLWSYSYGYSDHSIETRIAREVAAIRRLPFQSFTVRPYLFDRLDNTLASVEGFQDLTQCRQAAVVNDLADHADHVIAAHWGDVWLDDAHLGLGEQVATPNAMLSSALSLMQKGGRRWLMGHLCRPRLSGDDPAVLIRQMTSEELECVEQIDDPDFRYKAFKTDQWSFRWTAASLRMFQPGAFPCLPFYDNRLVDFFCTIPSQFLSGRRLQIDFLKRAAPDLARIKWQVYDANLYQYQHFNSWLLPKRIMKKAVRAIFGDRTPERNWEVQFLNEKGRDGLKRWLLKRGLRLHEFVSPDAVRQLLDSFYASPLKDNRGYTVSMLLTFSAWLEHYA